MSNNILILTDNLESKWEQCLINKRQNATTHDLLSFGVSTEQVFLNCELRGQLIRDKVQSVESKDISIRAEKEARTIYLNLIKDLPNKDFPQGSISKILSYNRRNLWWYLNISEKDMWADKMIHRLYAFLRFIYAFEAKDYQEIFIYIKDDLLKSAIIDYIKGKGIEYKDFNARKISISPRKYWFFFSLLYFYLAFRECAKIIFKLAMFKLAGINSSKQIAKGSVAFFSFYPSFWKNPFSENAQDVFFGSLPNKLARQTTVQHIIWTLSDLMLPFKQRKGRSEFFENKKAIMLEQLLWPSDIISIFDFKLFLRVFRVYQISFNDLMEVSKVDISDFAQESLIQSLNSASLFQWLLLDRALQRINTQDLKALFFRLEFQPFERALLYNTQGKTKTFGLQHSALSKNFLNYVFAVGELGEHWKNKDDFNSLPLPDYIFTSGSSGFNYMLKAGYPEDHLAICGGIRFASLFEYVKRKRLSKQELRAKYALPSDKRIIFMPTSQIINETLCMCRILLDSTKNLDESFHVIIKPNPNKSADPEFLSRIIKIFDKAGNKVSYEIYRENLPFYDCISLSDAVLLTGGSAAFEAMVLDIMPIIYVCVSQFSHNPMVEYPEAAILVYDVHSMLAALKTLNNQEALNNLKKHWPSPLEDMFSDISKDPNKIFLRLFKEQLSAEKM